MPKRYVKGEGWYYGSKGPFKSEAKLNEVIEAMYANGYKGHDKAKTKKKT